MRVIEGLPEGKGLHIAIVASRFNRVIVEGLLAGALEVLEASGVVSSDVIVVWVPGALELPLAAKRLVEEGDIDGVIALGCVIRGETAHYEHVGREAVGGLARLALQLGIPVATGVLTVENVEQAMIRSGLAPDSGAGKEANRHRGKEAARACLEMVNVLRSTGGQE